MVATVATWDESVLGCPALQGYSVRDPSLVVVGDVMTSFPTPLRTARSRPRVVQAAVIQTAEQFDAFELFFHTTLEAGLGWFDVVLYVPGGKRIGAGHIESYAPSPIGRNQSRSRTALTMDWVG